MAFNFLSRKSLKERTELGLMQKSALKESLQKELYKETASLGTPYFPFACNRCNVLLFLPLEAV